MDPYFILFIKTNSRQNNDLNIKHKTAKVRIKYIRCYVLSVGKAFSHKTKKAKDIKEQIDKFDHIII